MPDAHALAELFAFAMATGRPLPAGWAELWRRAVATGQLRPDTDPGLEGWYRFSRDLTEPEKADSYGSRYRNGDIHAGIISIVYTVLPREVEWIEKAEQNGR